MMTRRPNLETQIRRQCVFIHPSLLSPSLMHPIVVSTQNKTSICADDPDCKFQTCWSMRERILQSHRYLPILSYFISYLLSYQDICTYLTIDSVDILTQSSSPWRIVRANYCSGLRASLSLALSTMICHHYSKTATQLELHFSSENHMSPNSGECRKFERPINRTRNQFRTIRQRQLFLTPD